MPKLIACICGFKSPALVATRRNTYLVECGSCGTKTRDFAEHEKGEAVRIWNTRVQEAALEAKLKAVLAERDALMLNAVKERLRVAVLSEWLAFKAGCAYCPHFVACPAPEMAKKTVPHCVGKIMAWAGQEAQKRAETPDGDGRILQ